MGLNVNADIGNITTILCIPPPIRQYFSKDLLSIPTPKFRDDAETFSKMFSAAMGYVMKKTRSGKIGKREIKKCHYLFEELKTVYERIEAKEKEYTDKGQTLSRNPFYFFETPPGNGRKIYSRLKYHSYGNTVDWRNCQI